ncbi:MAG: MlaD family protein [Candidatus Hatepunaea meridiana]|nr:MlaD family protein [Candidatus Hatepunaea meridiana]
MREVTRAQRVRLGIFLLVAGGILITIMIIVTGSKLFEKRDDYFVRYRDVSVSGINIGAQVKYHGVRVGRVESIDIDPEQIETIVIALSLKGGTPVKTDVKAVISSLSITGIKIIELTGGSTEASTLEPGSEIPAGTSQMQMITGKAEIVSEKLELVLNNLANMTSGENQQRLVQLIDNTTQVLADVHIILEDNSPSIARTVENLEVATEEIRVIASSEAIRRTFTNLDTVTTEIKSAELGKAIFELREALTQARNTFTHLDLTLLKGRHDILTSLEIMRESLDSFNEFTRLISEDPSLLLRGTQAQEVGRGK